MFDLYSSIWTHRLYFTCYVFAKSNRNNPRCLSFEQEALPKFTLGELEPRFLVDLAFPSPALLALLHSHWQLKYLAPKGSQEKQLRYWCFKVENIQIDSLWPRNFQKLLPFYNFYRTKKLWLKWKLSVYSSIQAYDIITPKTIEWSQSMMGSSWLVMLHGLCSFGPFLENLLYPWALKTASQRWHPMEKVGQSDSQERSLNLAIESEVRQRSWNRVGAVAPLGCGQDE